MPFLVWSLKNSGHLDSLHMTVCTVGSRKSSGEDDFGSQGWGVFAPHLTIYGFDADADACEAANAELEARQINWTEKHIPIALANCPGNRTLYVTNDLQCSSLYQPNEDYLNRFSEPFQSQMKLDFSLEIETTTLDNFCDHEKIEAIDFLQTDVQGADMQVLQGSYRLLERSLLVVKAEVCFSHLYLNQPLFGDIDNFIRQQGFTLFKLTVSCRARARSPIVSSEHPGQFLWGDAFYIRDPLDPNVPIHFKTPDRILKVACIADLIGFPDYALELLEYLTLNYGNDPKYNCANNIVETLSEFPELVQQGLGSLPIVEKIRDYLSGNALELLEQNKDQS
jgi:FkbM family methyltransferase